MRRFLHFVSYLWVTVILAGLHPNSVLGQAPSALTFNEIVEPQSLSPINTQYDVEARFADLFFDKLIGYDLFMKPEPHLLASLDPVEISANKMTHTFKLREGVMWHALMKGRETLIPAQELSAQDVEFTYRIITDNRTDTDKRQIGDVIQDVVPVDKYKVKFVLNRPMEDIRNFLFFQVIPKHIFGPEAPEYLTSLDDFGTNKIVGTGPYRFLIWAQNKGIAMYRNDKYYKGWPELFEEGATYIDRVQMKIQRDENASKENLLVSGAQLLPLVNPGHFSELRNNPKIRVKNYNPRSIMMFAYNTKHPVLRDPKVRIALTHAVDRKRMLDNIYGASVAQDAKINILSGPFPGQESNPKLKPRDHDLEVGRRLLSEVPGVSIEGGKVHATIEGVKQPLSLRLRVYQTEEDKRRICEYFKDNLGELGIDVQMEFMPRGNWQKEVAKERDYDVTLVQYSFSPEADIVDELFSKSATAEGRNNLTLYVNERVERLLNANRETGDPQIRTENNHNLHTILWLECPATFLFAMPSYAAYRIDELGGVEIHPFDFFTFINNWYFLPKDEFDAGF